ncbi:MAG: GAF domain-containing protein [Chloroflexi bacterium]|nr:GAF domain-containing protein [Chloroflexota bacterium]
MTVHEVAPLLQASLATGVLVLVLVKGGFSLPSVRWFALFIVGQMLWGMAVFGLRSSSDLEWALRWERLTPAAVSLTVVSFYYFSKFMVRSPWPRWMTILAIAHLLTSLASIPTPFLVLGVEVAGYGNTAVWAIGLIPWTLPVYLMLGYAIATLYKGFKLAGSYTERNRLLLLLIAAFVSAMGSLLDVAPVLGLDVPPATSWTNSLFFVLAGIAILRYNLLDIQLVLQHRISYLLRSGANIAVLAVGVPVFMWIGAPLWIVILLSFGLVMLAEPAWRLLDSSLRARLEKDLRGELQTLLTLGTAQTGANTLQVADTVLKLLHKIVHPNHCAVLLLDNGHARPLLSHGYDEQPDQPLAPNHPLTQWLTSEPLPVFHSELSVEPQFQTMTSQNHAAVSALNATIYVPMMGRDTLEGILAVGAKAGGAIYSWQEIEFLRALGQQGALLLEGIRLTEADRIQRENMEHIKEIQRYMVQARDEERLSLATEIHAEPIQMVVGSVVRINLIRDYLNTKPDLVRQQLDHVLGTLTRAEDSLRRIMRGVFPSLLQDLGLLTALEALCQDLQGSGLAMTEVHLNMEVKGVPEDWSPPLAVGVVIYRFIQEGLRNILDHAAATSARVTVEYGPENVVLDVVDNGEGIDAKRVVDRRKEGHVGLLGLEERLGALGGSITLNNVPGGGARLAGDFPHQAPTPDPEARWAIQYDFTPLAGEETDIQLAGKAGVRGKH